MKTAKVSLTGLNLEKAINMLLKQNISFSCIDKQQPRCGIIEVDYRALGKVKKFAAQCNLKIKVIKNSPLETCTVLIKRRGVLVFGLVAVFAFILLLNGSYLKIRVDSSEKVSKEQVIALVEEFGLTKFTKLNKDEIDRLENYLNIKLEAVAHSLVQMRGSVLIVSIVDAEVKEPPVNFDEQYDIVAAFSGTITKIILIEGTQLVKTGDTVSQGQVLVKGEKHRIGGEVVPVRACAEIHADVSATGQVEFLPVSLQPVDTEKKYTINSINFFGLILKGKLKVPFEIYRTETRQFFLPVVAALVVSTVYYEQTMQEVTKTFTEEEEKLKTSALNLALKQLSIDNNYTAEYNVITYADKIIVEAKVKTNLIIGK